MDTKGVPASQLLLELVAKANGKEVITLGEINDHLSECGFAILMILFAFPMLFHCLIHLVLQQFLEFHYLYFLFK